MNKNIKYAFAVIIRIARIVNSLYGYTLYRLQSSIKMFPIVYYLVAVDYSIVMTEISRQMKTERDRLLAAESGYPSITSYWHKSSRRGATS